MKSLQNVFRDYPFLEYGITSFYPKRLLACRGVTRLPAKPKTVISVLFPYYSKNLKGNISKYAMVPDYHKVIGKFLQAICERLTRETGGTFIPFVDNSPIPEVYTAALSGLGYLGRNGLLIHPAYGSYVFLSEIVTDRFFPRTTQPIHSCLNCGLCEKHCPGKAIHPSTLQKDRCLSYITQSKQTPTEEQKKQIQKNGLLWGCDTCQEVCPMNHTIQTTPIASFQTDLVTTVHADEIERLVQTRAFGFRGAGVIKRNYKILYESQ